MECAKDIGENNCVINSINAGFIRLIHSYSSLNYKSFSKLGIHPGPVSYTHLRAHET